MQTFYIIIFWLAMGAATAYFANQRGRDPLVWFMLGMLLGFFGLLLLFVLPAVAEEEPVQEAEYALLDQKGEGQPGILQGHEFMLKDWYYYDGERNQQGPVRFERLSSLWQDGKINEETYIWAEGLDSWKRLDEVGELYGELREKEA